MAQSLLKVAIIGAGRPWRTEGATGFGMSHQHAVGYKQTGRCTIVAVADLVKERAQSFIDEHEPGARAYDDYLLMMEHERPDIVSISLWPHLHAKVTLDLLKFHPRAIHCEKPMDIHWDACVRMHDACKEANVQLTFNHQRRFCAPIQKAKSLVESGAIGELKRIDAAWSNLQDNGTHMLNTMFFLNQETPAEWVLAQVERSNAKQVFGAWQESQAVVTFRWTNGVRGNYHAGRDHADLGCLLRCSGSEGLLELLPEAPWLRLLRFGKDWESFDVPEGIHASEANARAVVDLVQALESGTTPLLSSESAIRSTEVIFAAFESSRRRGRVDLPLAPAPSALLEMLTEDGVVKSDAS